MKILIAEDEPVSREILQLVMGDFGICVGVVNGQEACDAFVRAYEQNDPYRLVCLDVVMPVIDGIETLKLIREFEKGLGLLPKEQAKIVMISAMGDPAHVMESFYRLCDGYLVKPADSRDIRALLKDLKNLRRR